MADNRESSNERPQHDVSQNSVKLDQVRNIAGGALLRTIPGQQARFMMTAAPVQSSSAVISSATTVQTQVLPKASVQGSGTTNQTNVSRLSSIPIQASTTASYHVPRGAAAVANIAVPRSSVATPIVRAPGGSSSLQTIGVAPQHNLTSSGGSIVGRPVLGVGPWLGVTTCLPNAQVQTSTTRQSVQQIRPPPISVGTRLAVGGQIRPLGEGPTGAGSQPRPVLLHTTTTHKQVTLTQQTQVQVTDKTVLKGYTGQPTRIGVVPSPTPSLSRITTSLPPAMVSLHPAVLVQSGQSIPLKGNAAQAKVITQPTHGSMQISSVPASSVQQSAIAISTVVTRPVMIASGGSVASVTAGTGGVVRQPAPKVFHPTSDQSSPVYIHTQTHKTQQGNNTVTSVVSLANTMYSLPTGTYYEGGSFQVGVTRPVTPSSVVGSGNNSNSSVQQQRPTIAQLQAGVALSEVGSGVGSLALTTMTPGITQSLAPKQNTSPRPSILRKRDPEGSPLKVQKNLNPVLSGLTVATPSSPPSPPKRPESGGGNGGQSSGGSTTISATSSPGGQAEPDSPPGKPEPSQLPSQQPSLAPPVHEERPQPQQQHHPVEMSPRKKPRKQQLTGNQMNEPTFSEDDMEFISDDKLKREIKEEVVEETEKCLPRRMMSLLNSYRHNWKSRNNHFIRYTDIKVKDEKISTLSEIANQKHALQKLNGWKIYHLGSQMEDMVNSETEFFDMYISLLSFLERKQVKTESNELDKGINRLKERIKANLQRSRVVKDQMLEAKSQVMKLCDHKTHVSDIITKRVTKRSLKKRERV